MSSPCNSGVIFAVTTKSINLLPASVLIWLSLLTTSSGPHWEVCIKLVLSESVLSSLWIWVAAVEIFHLSSPSEWLVEGSNISFLGIFSLPVNIHLFVYTFPFPEPSQASATKASILWYSFSFSCVCWSLLEAKIAICFCTFLWICFILQTQKKLTDPIKETSEISERRHLCNEVFMELWESAAAASLSVGFLSPFLLTECSSWIGDKVIKTAASFEALVSPVLMFICRYNRREVMILMQWS